MRHAAVAVLLLALIGAVFAFLRTASPDLAPEPTASAAPPLPAAPLPPAANLPANTVATRTLAAPAAVAAIPLADAPTAWLRVLDRTSRAPVVGAGVRSAQGGAEIVFTDDAGLAPLPLTGPHQLAVVADGYLLRLVPAQPGSTEQQPQEAQLVRDDVSQRVRLTLTTADGTLAGEAWLQCRAAAAAEPFAPATNDAVLRRAWQEHTMLARLPVGLDLGIEDGAATIDRVHRVANGAELRFVAGGTFSLAVATTQGLVGRASVSIAPGADRRAIEVPIALAPGPHVEGTVVGADGRPLAGAAVRIAGGDPLGLVATTGADGAFAIGPLCADELQLHVRHDDCEPQAFGPVRAGSAGHRVVLQPWPASTVRGRVRSRPDLAPIAAAAVVWSPTGGSPVTVRTDVEGRFVLRATGSVAARLSVHAPGHLPYAELVDPGAPFADYDLLPAVPETRVAKGLSAMLRGAVVDGRGQPVPGVPVRWVPAVAAAPAAGLPMRRVLEGAVLDLPGLATTGSDGSFAVETDHFGAGRLCLPDDVASPSRGIATEAVAGRTRSDLTLRR